MGKKLLFILAFALLTCISGYANLYINEVNSTGKWIEIYNDGSTTVDVGGYFVVRNNNDDATSAAQIPVGTTIAPKGFLTLFQGTESGGTALSPCEGAIDCLPFGISSTKFWNAILKDNNGYDVDNTFDIGNPQTVTVMGGQSWSRKTDGAATIVASDPTPGVANTTTIVPPQSDLKIYINEVNSTGKWIEIYNDEETEVNIDGFSVIRNNNDGAVGIATIPTGTTIASKGFLVIYQGTESGGTALSPSDGAIDCLSYGISSSKFMSAVLKDGEGKVVDNTFDIGNPQTVTVNGEKSWARKTDGDAMIVALDPTPGIANTTTILPPYSDLKIYVNEVNSTGKWIEIYNAEETDINVSGYTVTRSNNDGATNKATIPTGTTIASKGFLVIYQGTESGGTALSPCDGAIDCLPFGISSTKFWNAILKDEQGQIVDDTFDIGNPQTVTVSDDQSWARETDGAATVAALDPTPGSRNDGSTGLFQIANQGNVLASVHAGILKLPVNTSSIQLYSISGKTVLNRNIAETLIDLTNFPKGFYIIKLTNLGKSFTQKIVL